MEPTGREGFGIKLHEHMETLCISALAPYDRNSRLHSEAQVAQIAASIREFGFTNPVLVDEGGGVIAGHGRIRAAQMLGLDRVPCVRLSGLSDAQKRAYVIADNRLALNATWDDGLLAEELRTLQLASFDIDLIGFSEDELADLLLEDVEPLGGEDDDAPLAAEQPVTEPGDMWICGRHRILCGDATRPSDVAQLLAGARPHLMVTDLPYGVEYDPAWRAAAGINKNKNKMGTVANDARADWREAWALFPGDVAYVWHAGLFPNIVADSLIACGFSLRSQIIWAKDRFALSRGDYHWHHEPCWYAVREGATGHWQGDRSQSTLWQIKARESNGVGHGPQKPIACMRRPIENNSRRGEAVYEPFSGSGTTLIACEATGRTCYAMEIDPLYVDVAVKRWQNATGARARSHASGAPFPVDPATDAP